MQLKNYKIHTPLTGYDFRKELSILNKNKRKKVEQKNEMYSILDESTMGCQIEEQSDLDSLLTLLKFQSCTCEMLYASIVLDKVNIKNPKLRRFLSENKSKKVIVSNLENIY